MNETQVILNILDGLVAIISTGSYPNDVILFISSIKCYFIMYLNSGTNYQERRLYLTIVTKVIDQKFTTLASYPKLQAYLNSIQKFVKTNYPETAHVM